MAEIWVLISFVTSGIVLWISECWITFAPLAPFDKWNYYTINHFLLTCVLFCSYGSTSFAMSGLMKNVLRSRNTEFSLNEVRLFLLLPSWKRISINNFPEFQIQKFYQENKASLSSAQREVKQAIETTEGNIKWMENNYEVVKAWLEKQK